jgi:hypothetical protein
VAKFSLRRVENQAQASVIVSLLSVLPWAAATFWILKKFDYAEKMLYYGQGGRTGLLVCVTAALLLSAVGFGLGLSSAGQRRNDKQQWSWIGFFTGAIMLTLTIVVIAVFIVRGELVTYK